VHRFASAELRARCLGWHRHEDVFGSSGAMVQFGWTNGSDALGLLLDGVASNSVEVEAVKDRRRRRRHSRRAA
jgi:hypothetical protein